MKQIINKKRYDTETAEFIAKNSYSNHRDFNYISESLYRKKTGEFFIAGEGGAMTKYSKSISQNTLTGGEAITPLSKEEAYELLEQWNETEKIEELFGNEIIE